MPLFLMLLLVAGALALRPAQAQPGASGAGVLSVAVPSVAVQVENPLPEARPDEIVELDWAALVARLPGLSPERVRVVEAAGGAEVPAQVFAPGGAPAQLLFLTSLWPSETRAFRIEAAAPSAAPSPRAYAYHDAYRDDVAWENDRVAWRTYGRGLWNAPEYQPLVSSGVDVWLKRTRDLVIDRWYEKGHDAYHVDSGEGADFFSVGPTLGAGGAAVWAGGTLSMPENFGAHRLLARGPLRAVLEVDYGPWEAGGQTVAETRRITVDAGRHLYRQESRFTAAAPVPAAIGLVDRPEGVVASTRDGAAWTWLALWGPVERKNGGHGELGTAVLVPSARLARVEREARHYLAALHPSAEPVVAYVGAGWTASGDVPSVAAWWALLDAEARRLVHPVRVTLGAP